MRLVAVLPSVARTSLIQPSLSLSLEIPQLQDKTGSTAFDVANKKGHYRMVDTLQQHADFVRATSSKADVCRRNLFLSRHRISLQNLCRCVSLLTATQAKDPLVRYRLVRAVDHVLLFCYLPLVVGNLALGSLALHCLGMQPSIVRHRTLLTQP